MLIELATAYKRDISDMSHGRALFPAGKTFPGERRLSASVMRQPPRGHVGGLT